MSIDTVIILGAGASAAPIATIMFKEYFDSGRDALMGHEMDRELDGVDRADDLPVHRTA